MSEVRKYRKKPVVIEAVQWDEGQIDADSICDWMQDHGVRGQSYDGLGVISIPTLEGVMKAFPGDWIIRGVAGEFYPCKPDIFDATYEPVEANDE